MYTIRTIRTAVSHLLASGAGVIALAPLYLVVVNALKTPYDASSMSVDLPLNPQWGNFGTVVDQGKVTDGWCRRSSTRRP